MLSLVRALSLLVVFASLQLTLLRGGVGCPMPTADAMHVMASTAAGATHAGMTMADMHGDMAGAPSTAPGDDPSMAEHDAPCDAPAAPEQCQSMAPCPTAMIPPIALASGPAPQAPSFVEATLVLTPPSETFPPDLPPPRA